jgi:hypothetical protein
VLSVLGGGLVFLIATQVIDSALGDELRAKRRTRETVERDLKKTRFQARDLTTARGQNANLEEARAELAKFVSYPTRPEFQLDPAKGSAGNQYFSAVSRVREDLLRRAGRRNIRIAQDLGLPALAPTRDDEIARHLDALDLVERVVSLAIDERVQRIDKIEIKVDPGLRGRNGVSGVEKTRVKMKMVGPSAPMLRVIAATQSGEEGASILIEEIEIIPERTRSAEARLEVTFIAPRLHASTTDEN